MAATFCCAVSLIWCPIAHAASLFFLFLHLLHLHLLVPIGCRRLDLLGPDWRILTSLQIDSWRVIIETILSSIFQIINAFWALLSTNWIANGLLIGQLCFSQKKKLKNLPWKTHILTIDRTFQKCFRPKTEKLKNQNQTLTLSDLETKEKCNWKTKNLKTDLKIKNVNKCWAQWTKILTKKKDWPNY